MLAVHMRDSGVGIDPAQHDKVFAKFFQLEHTLTRQAGGNGLGLFLAKGIVELHGGTIGFRKIDGPGAEVVVRLPITAPAPDPGPELTEEITDV
jgi:signal transduction histidine kinase